MRRIKITIGYIGTAYSGWQCQPGRDTVQSRVEDALFSLTGERTKVIASGRTDAGVHAVGQVAHFDTNADYPVGNFRTGLNHFLPPDIRVTDAEETSADFHARFSAHEKTYCYCLYESDRDEAIYLGRAVRMRPGADMELMRDAAKAFIGKHDFLSFSSADADTTTSVRTIKRIRIVRRDGMIRMYFTADGFLYNMVRLIAGVLVSAGEGKIDRDGAAALIEAKSKHAVTKLMSPDGLYLVSVKYPPVKKSNRGGEQDKARSRRNFIVNGGSL